ncbi:hypothetical protein Q3G72_031576 [Acer saccharum]|nr:hypothetical protein Q3G72_031576 [Acer saccharum]
MMQPADQDKTSFITGQGLYCYKVMPFDLKNAGATCQHLVNKLFKQQIGRVAIGKFLGFMVHERGIEANPEKIKAIMDLESPTTL